MSTRIASPNPLIARLVVVLILAAMLIPLLPAPAAAQGSRLPENVLKSSVRIMTNVLVTPDDEDEDPFLCMLDEETILDIAVGSGTIITEHGVILTNHHVIDHPRLPREIRNFCEDQAPRGGGEAEFTNVVWLPDEKGQPSDPYFVEVLADSSFSEDLAVLQLVSHLDGTAVEGEAFPFVEFGDSDALREPETIITIGYPANAGSSRIVSEGIFSGWADNGYGVPWIYTDATISGGNSGGTAVNGDGLFIGIPTQATFSDCRPGDTNSDGIVDDNDQGCIGLGGNFGMLIPSNIARAFAEEAIGETIPIASVTQTEDDEVTPEPTDEDTPVVDEDGPAIGEITLTPLDNTATQLDTWENVYQIDACFDNNTLEEGDIIDVTWTWNGEVVEGLEPTYEWQDAWNPTACASIWTDEENGYLDPGIYQVTIAIDGEEYVSEEAEILAAATNVTDVTISGRDTDRNDVEATGDNVLTGEIETIYAEIGFEDMEEGAIWQAELILGDDTVWESDAEAWEGEATGSERLRMRHPELDAFEPGTYTLAVTVDGIESATVTLTIEP
jgi:S1-C subfamily serine protease